jgi:hypothetical protein
MSDRFSSEEAANLAQKEHLLFIGQSTEEPPNVTNTFGRDFCPYARLGGLTVVLEEKRGIARCVNREAIGVPTAVRAQNMVRVCGLLLHRSRNAAAAPVSSPFSLPHR